MAIHIAFLRGINVGGKNKIKMTDLREALEKLGLSKVQTYIQSGNVLFGSEEDEATLRQRIEREIERAFGLAVHVVMRTSAELKQLVANLPFSDKQIAEAEAAAEGECLYVSMLQREPDAERVEQLKAAAFDDQFRVAGRDIYLLLRQSIRHSKLAARVEKLGVPTTTRNWNTIQKLSAMADEMEEDRAVRNVSTHIKMLPKENGSLM